MTIAFFDFDGTIVKGDSLVAFLKYYFSRKQLALKSLIYSPIFLSYKFGLVSNSKAKEKLFNVFFSGEKLDQFNQKSKLFSKEWITKNLNSKAFERIQWHQEKGHEVVVVSASISNYLIPWCESLNVKVIATELLVENEKISGYFFTPNCYGKEKVARIKKEYDLTKYETSYGYGDSRGDDELLEFVDLPFYRTFG